MADVIADWAGTKGTVGVRIMLNQEVPGGSGGPRYQSRSRRRGEALSAGQPAMLGPVGSGRGPRREKSRHHPGH
jgi:hypothetical protein